MADDVDAQDWLDDAAHTGTSLADALAMFDRLPRVMPEEVIGRWKGAGLPTGHKLDGLLEAYGWYGKAFADSENVDPLLFGSPPALTAVDPRWIPLALVDVPALARSRWAARAFRLAKPLLRARGPTARLRTITYRGVPSAAMVYDRQPIIDIFRRVSADTLLGLMDMRGQRPFFFTLRRAPD